MPLETAQILCTVLFSHGIKTEYKSTHEHHPCVIWAGYSKQNFEWLCQLGIALSKEYTARYNKVHKSQKVIEDCAKESNTLDDKDFTIPPQAMPHQYRNDDVVKAYQDYYRGEKSKFAKWNHGEKPSWM